jgi:hypothetical protein
MSTKRNLLFAAFVILPLALLMVAIVPAYAVQRNAQSTIPSQSINVQNCGQIVVANGNLLNNATQAQQIANCFELAFQHCRLASLNFTTSSIDTGVIRILSVSKHGGRCNVTDTVTYYIAPRPPVNKQLYACSGVTQKSSKLLVTACGADGNVVIPFA